MALLLLLLLVVFLPQIVTSRPVLCGLIDRFAGLQPMKVDFQKVSAGWLSPVKVSGIEISAEDGTLLARIGQVETAKGLWGWITNSSDLGTVRIANLEASAIVAAGSTNVEQALRPFLDSLLAESGAPSNTQATTTTTSTTASGVIEVVDCKLLVAEAGRSEQWIVVIPSASVALPKAGQVTGPVNLQATIAEVSGKLTNSAGNVTANVQATDAGTLDINAGFDAIPIDFWHVVKARFPDLPVQELHGRVTATVTGSIAGDSAWSFALQQLSASDLVIAAPELVGDAPLKLQSISGAAMCSLENSMLQLKHCQIACDFANASADAAIPWPLELPSANDPFLKGATLHAQGAVNLPGLVATAGSLIPMREKTQLLSGNAQFAVTQEIDGGGQPTSKTRLELTDLKAVADGQEIVWQEPLTIEVSANKSSGKLALGAQASAEFATLRAGGTIESGTLKGDVDLALLQQRISQWIELPIDQMTGAAGIDLQWASPNSDVVQASGSLKTTPLTVSTNTGGTLNEPAWQGSFSCQLGLDGGSPQRIDLANLKLESMQEQLKFDLMAPLHFVTDQTKAPAGFSLDLRTDLANCIRRGAVWLSEPLDLQLSGKLQLAAKGVIDLEHVELLSANWSSEPLNVSAYQMSVSEPKVIGKFGGRIDTTDLTRLVVDVLQVQSTSFSVGAQDQAKAGDSQSRVGQALWRVDLDRLMQNVGAASSLVNAGDSAATTVSASGQLQGQLAWEVNPQAAGVNTRINGQNIVVLSKTPGLAASPLWQEPTVVANIAGTWLAESGAVDVQKFQVQLPWMDYDGKVAYDSSEQGQTVQLTGQMAYDAAQLSSRLASYTGGQVQLQGQQSVPLEVKWSSTADTEQPALAALNGSTRLGWQQGKVAGIPLGSADVPISIEAGQLRSAAEIPVSGGALRWDINSNLAADNLVIEQSPMVVLDNVEITEEMCNGWLKYVAPLLAQATSVDGRLSLRLDQAQLTPTDTLKQTVVGQIVIHNATVGPGPLSNQIILLAKQIEAIRKQDFTQTVSSTQKVWLNMPEQRIDFQMLDGKVIHNNLTVKVGDVNISTGGSVGIDGQLEMLATMPIPDDWADKSQWLAGLRGQSLQFPIRGTLSNPQIDSRFLSQLGTQAVQNAANGVIQKQLNRGLDKLLGGSTNAPPTGTETPNPIQGIGGQILNGQGLNLPGFFPGFGGPQAPPRK